mmetsp:Transcript_38122/g.96405  ORF Transcript_38122/g.96405 Transcript_38122/m.96405 type:complete len:210 (+) Transcript_38122:2958-3587(+)
MMAAAPSENSSTSRRSGTSAAGTTPHSSRQREKDSSARDAQYSASSMRRDRFSSSTASPPGQVEAAMMGPVHDPVTLNPTHAPPNASAMNEVRKAAERATPSASLGRMVAGWLSSRCLCTSSAGSRYTGTYTPSARTYECGMMATVWPWQLWPGCQNSQGVRAVHCCQAVPCSVRRGAGRALRQFCSASSRTAFHTYSSLLACLLMKRM